MNRFTEAEPSPLVEGVGIESVLRVDPAVEAERRAEVATWRSGRDASTPSPRPSTSCGPPPRTSRRTSCRPPSHWRTLAARPASGSNVLRDVFGEFRAPTGVGGGVGHRHDGLLAGAAASRVIAEQPGGPPRLLVAKPGLDGHSNGAEQIAVAARDAGFEVIYQGIRLTPEQIAASARDEDVDVIGLSILSGSHLELIPEVLDRLRDAGVDAPVVVGGIIPYADAGILRDKGVAAVYTPKDFDFSRIMDELAELAEAHRSATSGEARFPQFEAQVAALPPVMRFMVRHAVAASVGALVLFGGLLVFALTGLHQSRALVAVFCVVSIAAAIANLVVTTLARRRFQPAEPGDRADLTG